MESSALGRAIEIFICREAIVSYPFVCGTVGITSIRACDRNIHLSRCTVGKNGARTGQAIGFIPDTGLSIWTGLADYPRYGAEHLFCFLTHSRVCFIFPPPPLLLIDRNIQLRLLLLRCFPSVFFALCFISTTPSSSSSIEMFICRDAEL